MILKKIIKKFDKSTIKAGEGLESGIYPLYTCSQIVNKFLDDYLYDDEAIIVSTGGNFSIHYIKGKFNYSTDCYVFNTDKYNLKYLYYYLLSKSNDINKMFRGAGLKHLNKNEFVNLNIKDISIDKQENIVNRLDKINQMITLRKKEIDYCNCLIKSQFVEMFGDIKNTNYNVLKLNDLSNLITDGEHKKPNYTIFGKPFISVINITTEKLKFDGCKYVSEDDNNKFRRRCNPELNDILYTKVGATYGRSAIVDTNIDFSLYVSVCLIKPKKEVVNPLFLMHSFRQPYVKMQADKCIKGIGVPDLHLIEIKNFNIIVPPLELQNKFARIVEQIDKQKFVNINIFQLLDKMFPKCYNNLIDFY